ncbi:hypothetical protein [Paenibacillus sp. Soil724D2]|uniref:hypothetical protein n=1 Tax=Paenibacillus sp. (strain Soil724D2) TaxID=1736392 RepID=UPI000713E017|nr:hypothetical protein [Paenibacillus sp. Soil724D2]KRE34307.1 hypothetical protein ASG85_13160 [Paenibacillus sp. Soil724D2]
MNQLKRFLGIYPIMIAAQLIQINELITVLYQWKKQPIFATAASMSILSYWSYLSITSVTLRMPHCLYGSKGDRTTDLIATSDAQSQPSYAPHVINVLLFFWKDFHRLRIST